MENQSEPINTRLSKEIKEKAMKLAEKSRRTFADYIRILIEDAVQANKIV